MGFTQECNVKKVRTSNFEMYRVITMLLIVLHHYVVNSGLLAADGPVYTDTLSFRSLFLLIAGAWGKTGINCFVLITGYFMCRSHITLRKFAKLLLQVMFYRIVISLVFWLSGYAPFSWLELIKVLIPVRDIGTGFTGAYLVFFLFIPFLNSLIGSLSEKQHVYLLLLCGFLYVFLGTVPLFSVTMNYVSWFAVLYLIAAYLRLYPKPLYDNQRFWGWATAICVAVSVCSVVACSILGKALQKNFPYYFVSDANTLLAVCTAVSSFLLVKNTRIRHCKLVNGLGATTFGVLLIHAGSDTMRQWLWVDVLDCVGMYNSPWMPLHALGSCILIFAVCALIDYLRIRFLEMPLLSLWDRHESALILKFQNAEKRLCSRLCIHCQKSEQEDKK